MIAPEVEAVVRERVSEDLQAWLTSLPDEPDTEVVNDFLQAGVLGYTDALGQTRTDAEVLARDIINNTTGFGPLSDLMEIDEVDEIQLNGGGTDEHGMFHPPEVYVVVKGVKRPVPSVKFESEAQVLSLVGRMADWIRRPCTPADPLLAGRLPDGSRLAVTHNEIARRGTSLTVRKFSMDRLTVDDLIRLGSGTPNMFAFLKSYIAAGGSLIVSGRTGCGKTTLMNNLMTFVDGNDRVVTVEENLELQIRNDNWLSYQARPANADGKGTVTINDCVVHALLMNPDWLCIGEVRSVEALELTEAANTGHSCMATLHANSPREAVYRLANLCLRAAPNRTEDSFLRDIVTSFPLIVHLDSIKTPVFDANGRQALDERGFPQRVPVKRIERITAIVGYQNNILTTSDLFVYDRAQRRHVATGEQPQAIKAMIEEEYLPYDMRWFRNDVL